MRDTCIKIGSVIFLVSVPLSSYLGIRAIESSTDRGAFGFAAFLFWFFAVLSLISLYATLFAAVTNNKNKTGKILVGIGLIPLSCVILLAIYSGILTNYWRW